MTYPEFEFKYSGDNCCNLSEVSGHSQLDLNATYACGLSKKLDLTFYIFFFYIDYVGTTTYLDHHTFSFECMWGLQPSHLSLSNFQVGFEIKFFGTIDLEPPNVSIIISSPPTILPGDLSINISIIIPLCHFLKKKKRSKRLPTVTVMATLLQALLSSLYAFIQIQISALLKTKQVPTHTRCLSPLHTALYCPALT